VTERILKAWYEQDFVKVADELIEAAGTWKNGSIDGCLVFDTQSEKLAVVSESQSTYTPSYIYLFRLRGDDKPDTNPEDLFFDLKELDIEGVLESVGR